MGTPAEAITRHYRGDWSGNQGLIPAPGHSAQDRGVSVKDAENGDVIFHSFNGVDWREIKDECRRLGLIGERDRSVDRGTRASAAKVFYDYRDESGAILFRVERRGKSAAPPFLQHGPDGKGDFYAAKGCMTGVRRVPYRLPELLAADQRAIVYICEGEKDADRLAREGLIATTNPGGAGKFTADLARHFSGRRVVALQDNDEPGAAHVASVLRVLDGIADQAAVLLLPGLGPKGDASDWLESNSVFDLGKLAERALSPPEDAFEIADLGLWSRTTPTPKAFLMAPYIPRDDVIIITGDGGTNKSTLALQISACSAVGKRMLGMDVLPGPALYMTAEDDQRENHWRLHKIAAAIGTTLAQLEGKLSIVSLRGRLNNELATFDHDGKMHPSPAYKLLRATIKKTGAKLVTLDNVAHLFAGNENDRSNVTAFVNLLYQICGDLGVTILLIAHRNKAGDSYSGSTAWLNAVRSQLLIERSDDGDPDMRRLSLGKANYARQGEHIDFRWHDFALVRDTDLPDDRRKELDAVSRANADDTAFLACLHERTRQEQAVSEKTSATYAPTVFERMPESKRIGKKRLEASLERLIRTGRIERSLLPWKRDRKDVYGLRLTCADGCADTVRQRSRPLRADRAQHTHYT